MGWPFPLLAKHILYINLATDGSPAIALSMEQSEPDIMRRKPRNPNESILFGIRKWLIPIPIILATVTLLLFWNTLNVNGWDSDYGIAKARTMVFALIVFFELFFAFSCRSFKHNIHQLGFLNNKLLLYSLLGETSLIIIIINYPPLQEIFDLVPLEIADWVIVIILSTSGFTYSEIIKLFNKDKINKKGQQTSITVTLQILRRDSSYSITGNGTQLGGYSVGDFSDKQKSTITRTLRLSYHAAVIYRHSS